VVARHGRINEVVAVAATVSGAIVGAVIAGMAIQTAAFDRTFLLLLKEISLRDSTINTGPARYLSPFLTTAGIGVAALVCLLAWAALPEDSHVVMRAVFGSLSGGLTLWSMASLIPALGTLIQFVALLNAAAGDPPRDRVAPRDGINDDRRGQ